MSFALVCIVALAALGVVAAIASRLQGDENPAPAPPEEEPTDGGISCSSCSAADDGSCLLHCMMEEKKRGEGNKTGDSSVKK